MARAERCEKKFHDRLALEVTVLSILFQSVKRAISYLFLQISWVRPVCVSKGIGFSLQPEPCWEEVTRLEP